MTSLEKKHFGVRTIPLTEHIVDMIEHSSNVAIDGDGTCNRENMEKSCFASENCSLGTPLRALKLKDLLHQEVAYVTVDDNAQGMQFVGCVSAAPASKASYVDYRGFEPGSIILSNLCVSSEYRGRGLGRTLVDRILDKGKPTYLLISKKGLGSSNKEVDQAFTTRVQRLQNTYSALGFDVVDIQKNFIILKHDRRYQKTRPCKCQIKNVFFFDDTKEFLEIPIENDGLGVIANEHGGHTVAIHVEATPSSLPHASIKRRFPNPRTDRVGSPHDRVFMTEKLVKFFDKRMVKHDPSLAAQPNNLVSWLSHLRPYFQAADTLFVFDFDLTLQARPGFVVRSSSLKQYTLVFTDDKHDADIERDLVTAMFGGWERFHSIVKLLSVIKNKIVVSANPCEELIRDICKKHLGFEYDGDIFCNVQNKMAVIDEYIHVHNKQPSTFLNMELLLHKEVPPQSYLSYLFSQR